MDASLLEQPPPPPPPRKPARRRPSILRGGLTALLFPVGASPAYGCELELTLLVSDWEVCVFATTGVDICFCLPAQQSFAHDRWSSFHNSGQWNRSLPQREDASQSGMHQHYSSWRTKNAISSRNVSMRSSELDPPPQTREGNLSELSLSDRIGCTHRTKVVLKSHIESPTPSDWTCLPQVRFILRHLPTDKTLVFTRRSRRSAREMHMRWERR